MLYNNYYTNLNKTITNKTFPDIVLSSDTLHSYFQNKYLRLEFSVQVLNTYQIAHIAQNYKVNMKFILFRIILSIQLKSFGNLYQNYLL